MFGGGARRLGGKDIQDPVDNGIAGSLVSPTDYSGALEMPYVVEVTR